MHIKNVVSQLRGRGECFINLKNNNNNKNNFIIQKTLKFDSTEHIFT